MKLTTRGRFAVTAMLDIALSKENHPVSLVSISTRQKISLSYLEQLFGKLRRAGLVASVRGPGGGYRLMRPVETISVAEIIRAVDESLDSTRCGGKANCHEERPCLTHHLWISLNEKMYEYLDSVYLTDLISGSFVLAAAPLVKKAQSRPAHRRQDNAWRA